MAEAGAKPSRRRLGAEEIDRCLADLPGWERTGDAIWKKFKFPGWADALAFTARVGAIAASWDHHPDSVVLRYGEVTVTYTTPDAGGITEMDLAAAASVEGKGEAI